MALTQQAKDFVFKIIVQEPQAQASTAFLNQLCIIATSTVVSPDPKPTGLYHILSEEELPQYLGEPQLSQAKRAFDYLPSIYLQITEQPETFSDIDFEAMNVAFTAVFTSGIFLDQDIINAQLANTFADFRGVLSMSTTLKSAIPQATLDFALTPLRSVYSDSSSDAWAISYLSFFLSQSTFSNHQYTNVVSTSEVIEGEGFWNYLFSNKINYVIPSQSLGLFAIGGVAGADIYIQKQIQLEVQNAFEIYTQKYEPAYSDKSRIEYENAAFFVLNQFKQRGEIISFENPFFPPVEQQTAQNKNSFILAGLEIKATYNSAIWRVLGTIS